jgi:hypothetical protein
MSAGVAFFDTSVLFYVLSDEARKADLGREASRRRRHRQFAGVERVCGGRAMPVGSPLRHIGELLRALVALCRAAALETPGPGSRHWPELSLLKAAHSSPRPQQPGSTGASFFKLDEVSSSCAQAETACSRRNAAIASFTSSGCVTGPMCPSPSNSTIRTRGSTGTSSRATARDDSGERAPSM